MQNNIITLPSEYKVTGHTDFVGKGSTFVAIPGAKADGLNFVPLALQKGASCIVIQQDCQLSQDLKLLIESYNATIMIVPNCRKALAQMSAESLDYPAKKLKIVGITGTKGKTSTAYMMYHVLQSIGKKAALISTVEKRIGADEVQISLTTPLPDQIHVFLHECVVHDVEYVVMEVSAQALSLQRVDGIEFEAGVFTNFSHEHLEFYADLEEYFHAKSLMISCVKDVKNMFINIDDEHGKLLQQQYPGCSSFSLLNKQATVYGSVKEQNATFIQAIIDDVQYDILQSTIGLFNSYNLLGVISLLYVLGIDLNACRMALQDLKYVPGRMEPYLMQNGARCFIDYAHNPSSFEAVLSTLRSLTTHLIVVFGAAGNRDKQKRPLMAAVAQKYCDVVILTSDNPRDENPVLIAQDTERGFDFDKQFVFYRELNRVRAIELGCESAKPESIVAILGKGRDEYQIVGDLKFAFKERLIIKPFLVEHDQGNV